MNALAEVHRVPATSSPAASKSTEQSYACFAIDGEIVLVDTEDFALDGKSLAAVVLWDGKIDVRYAKLANERSYLGKRTGFFASGKRGEHGNIQLMGCVILGKVIGRE